MGDPARTGTRTHRGLARVCSDRVRDPRPAAVPTVGLAEVLQNEFTELLLPTTFELQLHADDSKRGGGGREPLFRPDGAGTVGSHLAEESTPARYAAAVGVGRLGGAHGAAFAREHATQTAALRTRTKHVQHVFAPREQTARPTDGRNCASVVGVQKRLQHLALEKRKGASAARLPRKHVGRKVRAQLAHLRLRRTRAQPTDRRPESLRRHW